MIARYFVIPTIEFYQNYISPILTPRCRHIPSCSEYTKQCFQELTLLKAIFYSFKRILSCNPWSSGGFDPIPTKKITLSYW